MQDEKITSREDGRMKKVIIVLGALSLQRNILSNPHRGQFSFPVGKIGPVVFQLGPFNQLNKIYDIENFHG